MKTYWFFILVCCFILLFGIILLIFRKPKHKHKVGSKYEYFACPVCPVCPVCPSNSLCDNGVCVLTCQTNKDCQTAMEGGPNAMCEQMNNGFYECVLWDSVVSPGPIQV